MSTDSTDPTRAPGIAGEADTSAPHPQAPEGPDASGTHGAPQVPSYSTGFWVAITMNGSGRARGSPSMET